MLPVRAHDRDRMSLLGLALETSLRRAYAGPSAPRLEGTIALQAGGMELTLRFSPSAVEIRQGTPRKYHARLSGELVPLVELAAGKLPVSAFFSNRVRASGDLRLLWRFARLLRAARAAVEGA